MARFEPGPPPRPPRRSSEQGHAEEHSPVEGVENLAEKLRQLDSKADRPLRRMMGRFAPRMPRRMQRRIDRLPPEMKYRLQLVSGIFQTVGLIVFGSIFLAVMFQMITQTTLVEPKTAKAVLEKVKTPDELGYSVEVVRIKRIDRSLLRRDSIRGMQVRPKDRKLQSLILGVGDIPFRMVSDGEQTLLQFEGRPAQQISNPRPDDLRPVQAEDLVAQADRIVDNKATVAGQRGWLLSWKPTPQILMRLLSANLLRLEEPDIKAIARGDFKPEYASVTVVRRTRKIHQIDTTIQVNGARMRILATYRSDRERLKGFDIPERLEDDTVN